MIDQQLLQDLIKSPAGTQLISTFKEELDKLNRLDDLDYRDPNFTLFVLSRLNAYKTLKKMLEPLISYLKEPIITSEDSEFDIPLEEPPQKVENT